MGFIERLKQEDTVKAIREEQLRVQQEERQAAIVMEKAQKALAERERHTRRREQAEDFRKESGIGLEVDKLAEYLKLKGSLDYREGVSYTPKDPDSVENEIKWDCKYSRVTGYGDGYHIYTYKSWSTWKSIAVETCSDGTIVFHAGKGGSSMIKLNEWRSPKKDQLFEKAIEKAYRNPGTTVTDMRTEQDDFHNEPTA